MEREIRCPQPIVFISRNKIKEGQADEFRKHYQDSVPPIIAGKAGTWAQLAYENEETAEVTIVRFFADADALDLQMKGADKRSKKTYEFIEPISIEIFGTSQSTRTRPGSRPSLIYPGWTKMRTNRFSTADWSMPPRSGSN